MGTWAAARPFRAGEEDREQATAHGQPRSPESPSVITACSQKPSRLLAPFSPGATSVTPR